MPASTCPSCRRPFAITREAVRSAVVCPHCQQRLILRRRRSPASPLDVDPEFLPPAQPAAASSFALSDGLGAASLITGGMAFLTLLLPCFWFLALPLSGLGVSLGFLGLLTASRDRHRVFALVGLVGGLLLVLLSAGLILCFQWDLLQLQRSLQQTRY